MRYSLLAPGKRVRPLLVLLTAAHCGADWRDALDLACAVEMVHTASLILDDLPSMDNAELRRGLPTLHRLYGEDTAILAAVSLMNQAFVVVSSSSTLSAEKRLKLVSRLAFVIGPEGLAAGQNRDLHERASIRNASLLEEINHLKTGMLFRLAAEMGGTVAGVNDDCVRALQEFADALGQAFQARDDLLDQIGCPAELGKNVFQDQHKATLVKLMGEEGVREAVKLHTDRALAFLEGCSDRRGVLQDFILQSVELARS
ncbi:MAG: polyprenyl synthetase family protein [Ectothiorhodospiraceae bacterium]|nr:polyprenyl synthetase family protein [Ectothiorhodospiraceae bacterium]MCH8503478.1 polyprenyl synthetase family protein [Ectothiorhodospiraceae bacterium]